MITREPPILFIPFLDSFIVVDSFIVHRIYLTLYVIDRAPAYSVAVTLLHLTLNTFFEETCPFSSHNLTCLDPAFFHTTFLPDATLVSDGAFFDATFPYHLGYRLEYVFRVGCGGLANRLVV